MWVMGDFFLLVLKHTHKRSVSILVQNTGQDKVSVREEVEGR